MQLKSKDSKTNLILRPLKDSDAEVLATLANNKKIWDNIRDKMPHPYNVNDARFFINSTKENVPQVTFAIVRDDEFCGVIGLILQSDVYRLSAEMGYWIGEPYWGQGITTEAIDILSDYGFESLGLIRIYAGVYEYNLGSMRVLEKNGFLKEGVARKAVIKNGGIYDEHRYGRLKGE